MTTNLFGQEIYERRGENAVRLATLSTDVTALDARLDTAEAELALIDTEAWTAYTPTNTNVTVGNGLQSARFTRMGRTIFWEYQLIWGTTTAFGGTVEIGLPAAAYQSSTGITGSVFCQDATGNTFIGLATTVSASVVQLRLNNTPNVVNATVPFTWTTSDALVVGGSYEGAS